MARGGFRHHHHEGVCAGRELHWQGHVLLLKIPIKKFLTAAFYYLFFSSSESALGTMHACNGRRPQTGGDGGLANQNKSWGGLVAQQSRTKLRTSHSTCEVLWGMARQSKERTERRQGREAQHQRKGELSESVAARAAVLL